MYRRNINRGFSSQIVIVVVAFIIIVGGIVVWQQQNKGTESIIGEPAEDLVEEDLMEEDSKVSETIPDEKTPQNVEVNEENIDESFNDDVAAPGETPVESDVVPEEEPQERDAEEDSPVGGEVETPIVIVTPPEESEVEVVIPITRLETAYAINEFDGTISVIDVATETVTNTVKIVQETTGISALHSIIVSPDKTHIYVTDRGGDKVIVVKVSDLSVVTEISVGDAPNGLALTPDGNKLYVANFSSDTVSVIDTSTYTVTKTLAVDRRPSDVTVTPDGKKVYVTHRYETSGISNKKRILIIDVGNDTIADEIDLLSPSRSRETVFSPDGAKAFISIQGSNGVGVINTLSKALIRTIQGMLNVNQMTISKDGKMLYVVSATDNVATIVESKLYVINTETEKLTRQLSGFRAPRGIALTEDGSKLYVTEYKDDEIRIFDLGDDIVTSTISIGDTPRDIVIIPAE